VSYRRLDQIEGGPLLELAIDGEKMVAFIRSRVLSRLLEAPPAGEEPAPPEQALEDRVMGVLEAITEPCGIGEIERRTGIPRRRLGKILKVLREDGKIEMIDARGQARYRPGRPEGG
jgi:DNA-binding transcriptional ArsR family regulator